MVSSYRNSLHALHDLILPRSNGHSGRKCHITKLSDDGSQLENGIDYCLVEVTCDNGEQYGIQDFGEEAMELHKEALKQSLSITG